jgi:nicotinate-nucleotide adenylyltransferase
LRVTPRSLRRTSLCASFSGIRGALKLDFLRSRQQFSFINKMKIGLFGGTFNPIHFGHLRAALEVKEGCGLDQVLLIPAAVPPHKDSGALAAAVDRLRMIELAAEGEPGLAASDIEIRRGGPSYTVDTVRHFRRELPAGTDIFLIVGLDAFLEIDTWKSFRELLTLVPVIVISRPDASHRSAGSERDAVADFIRSRISPSCTLSGDPAGFSAEGVRSVTLFSVTALDVSSRRIRDLAAAGRSIRFLVPEPVRNHIKAKGLYL